MKDLDLTSLRYFVAACEWGNIARAAEHENVVPSAISKRLAQLEQDLGVVLLQRQRRGVAPTQAGELLLEQARALLASAHRLVQDVSSFGSGVRGQVRLLATVSAIAEALPDDVAAFLQLPEHRHITVDIEESLSTQIVRRIKEGSATLGVLWDASQLDGLQQVPYRHDHLAVVVHADHPLAEKTRGKAKASCWFVDTLAYEHVGLQSSTAVNSMLLRAAALAGSPLKYRTQVSTFEATLRVVKAGLGISIIPIEIAAPYASVTGLKVLPLKDAWAQRRFCICFRDQASLPKAAQMLLDFLTQAARANPSA